MVLRCAVDQPNRWSFRCRANVNGERVAVHRAAGKLFQITGPATMKLLIPSLVLVLGTDSVPMPADCRCRLLSMAENARQSSVNYVGAIPTCTGSEVPRELQGWNLSAWWDSDGLNVKMILFGLNVVQWNRCPVWHQVCDGIAMIHLPWFICEFCRYIDRILTYLRKNVSEMTPFVSCGIWDMRADRQTDRLITILCTPAGGGVKICWGW